MRIVVETSEAFPNFYDFIMYDGSKKVGLLQVQDDKVVYMWIRGSWRRQGHGTRLYDYARYYLNKVLYPIDISNTTEAIGFWKGMVGNEYVKNSLYS